MHTLFLGHEAQIMYFLVTAERAGDLPPRSLFVLVADDLGRLAVPIGVDDVPEDPPQDERIGALATLIQQLAEADFRGALLAVGRDGDPSPRGGDFGWHDALAQCCRAAGVVCYGTYVATPYGVRRVRPFLAPPDLLAA